MNTGSFFDYSSLLTRRDFIRKQGKAALYAAAVTSGSGLLFPLKSMAGSVPDIAVAGGKPDKAVRAAVSALGGMSAFVNPGDKVVIKPNMSFAQGPDQATNTHPDVVKTLAEMCLESKASSVAVLDNPLQNASLCLKRSGIEQACSDIPDTRVQTLNSKRFFRSVVLEEGQIFREAEVMLDVLDADVLIAAPVAKSHSATGVSLSMKGMMGLIRNRGAMHRSSSLDSAIVDLCTLLRADLTVIDATRVLASHGPFGPGEVLRGDTVIASRDMVAADACTVEMFPWYGRKISADKVGYLREAHKRGLGRMDVQSLNIESLEA